MFCAAFPPQEVQFSLLQTNILADNNIIMSCYGTRQTTLLSSTLMEVTWLDNNNNKITLSDNFNVTGQDRSMKHNITSRLTVSNMRTSQAGVYTCVVNMTIPGVVENNLVRKSVTIYVTSKQVGLCQ